MKERAILKNIVISGVFLSFLVLAGTGILKFKKITQFLPISPQELHLQTITTYHEYAGLFLIFFVLIHLIIQRAWFVYIVKTIFKSKIIFFIIGLVLALIVFWGYNQFNKKGRGEAKSDINRLAEVEVREYQGENLSSIKDFRENSIKGPQYVDINNYKLEITGLVNQPYSLSYDEVLQQPNYEKLVILYCVEGWNAKILWEGILIKDLIDKAKPNPEVNTVIFHAYDGYTSSLPLSYIEQRNILLADKMNGVVLPPERGFPFQVVAEDKWGYKWVKWVTKIELSDNKDYKGYWESAGYSNDANIHSPKFGE